MAKTLGPNAHNYLYGKGEVLFKPSGADGFDHLGNCPAFALNVELEKTDHYSSMSGTKEKDLSFVNQKSATGSITLEEFTPANVARAFMAEGTSESSQAAGTLDEQEVTVVEDAYIDLGKVALFVTKLSIGTESGTGFEVGEVVTGGTSAATGTIAWAESGLLELVNVSGEFQLGEEVSGGSSSTTANVQDADKGQDVVLVDAASAPTTRYEAGVDYDVNVVGGMLRVRSEGGASGTVYLSADYGAVDMESIDALTASEVQGELLFIGTADQGPRYRVQAWKANLTISGEVGFISDEVATIPMSVELLADRTNHPSSPFFRATKIG